MSLEVSVLTLAAPRLPKLCCRLLSGGWGSGTIRGRSVDTEAGLAGRPRAFLTDERRSGSVGWLMGTC